MILDVSHAARLLRYGVAMASGNHGLHYAFIASIIWLSGACNECKKTSSAPGCTEKKPTSLVPVGSSCVDRLLPPDEQQRRDKNANKGDATCPVAGLGPSSRLQTEGMPTDLDLGMSSAGKLLHLSLGANPIDAIAIVNGSDLVSEPVSLFRFSKGNSVPTFPTWTSQDHGFHTGVCAGDLDHDGLTDLVVTSLGAKPTELGGVKAYYGTKDEEGKPTLEPLPVWLATGFDATDCAVLNLDGNEHPDVVVSSITDPQTEKLPDDVAFVIERAVGSLSPYRRPALLQNGSVRLVLNAQKPKAVIESKVLRQHPPPSSCSQMRYAPGALLVEDLNDDGRPDLVAGGSRVAVWFGSANAEQFTEAPDWYSKDEYAYTPGLDVAYLPQLKRKVIVASRGCISPNQRCCADSGPNGYFMYDPLNPEVNSPLRKVPGVALWSSCLAKDIFAGTVKLVAAKAGEPPDLIAAIQFDNHAPGTCPTRFGGAMRRYAADPQGTLSSQWSTWNDSFDTVVKDLELIRSPLNPKCESLLAVSGLPFVQSRIFPDVANCH